MAELFSARVDVGPAHDHVRIWNRGGLAGTLTVTSGDGSKLVAILGESPPTRPALPGDALDETFARAVTAAENIMTSEDPRLLAAEEALKAADALAHLAGGWHSPIQIGAAIDAYRAARARTVTR